MPTDNRPGADQPHLPSPAPIDAYGNGGFRFAGMSHRGSLLCLPDGIWPLAVSRFEDLTAGHLSLVFARAAELDIFLIGCGIDMQPLPEMLRGRFRELHMSVDAMQTGPAVRTYNILLAERRRVGAALIAVD
ncbi:MAG TPA: MTH938/NDUFAF3 family protein [Pseudolabrys sp.]|nr:MTH938/NDUFAF3 family protein [Pseudolabrys sp.]